jgi:threonine synthase
MEKIYLQCVECNEQYPADGAILTCPKHDPKFSYLEVLYDYSSIKKFPDFNIKSWDRFLSLLPIDKFTISLNEISTEPTSLNKLGEILGYSNLYLKDETKNVTGSFKDKESLISINKALEFGYKQVYTVSSGNGAISACAYATKAGIDCKCFIPGETSQAKQEMIKKFRGIIIKFPGLYEDVYKKVIKIKPKGWHVTSGVNPFGNEGDKITAFEIWESMGVPDYVVVPCGNGGNLYGIWKGFNELKLLGLTKSVPKMIGVQIEGSAPLKVALNKDSSIATLSNIKESIAEGIVAKESYTSPKTIKALKESGGELITVSDPEIEKAMDQVEQHEVILGEITAASAFAALPKLKCSPNSKIVVILTGTGMKYLSYLKNEYFGV